MTEEVRKITAKARRNLVGTAAVEIDPRRHRDRTLPPLVSLDGTTYDGSVRTRLAALRRRLASPGPGTAAGAS